jgi:hypothetical protein
MTAGLLLVAAALASYLGFACLALAMPEHGPARPLRWLRPAGCALLVLSYALCLLRDGVSFGSMLWVLLASAAAIAVTLTLAWLAW